VIVEDPQGVLGGQQDPTRVSILLQDASPPTGSIFPAWKVGPAEFRTLVAQPTVTVNSFLAIDHSAYCGLATPNGLLRFNRERENSTYDERDGGDQLVLGIVEDQGNRG
jgi:hypothetical protein